MFELLGKLAFAGIVGVGCMALVFATGGLFLIPLAFGLPLILGIAIGKKVKGKNA